MNRSARLALTLTLLAWPAVAGADPLGAYRVDGHVTNVRLDDGLQDRVCIQVGDPVTGFLRFAEPRRVAPNVWEVDGEWEFRVGSFLGFGDGINSIVNGSGHWFEFNGPGEQGQSNVGLLPWSFFWSISAAPDAPGDLPGDFTGPGRAYGDWAGLVPGHPQLQWLNFHADLTVTRVPEPSSGLAAVVALAATAFARVLRRATRPQP